MFKVWVEKILKSAEKQQRTAAPQDAGAMTRASEKSKKDKDILRMALLAVAFIVAGCQSPKPVPLSRDSIPAQMTRNNCYSLLHQLLDEQKDVSILRFIKSERSDVKDLVKKIAATSKTDVKLLEEAAKLEPAIPLEDYRLPTGEAATRDAIAKTKQKQLLGRKGDAFELTLLLTQTDALSYASHLAKVASENEPQADRARMLADVSSDMENLNDEVFALLLSKTKTSAANVVRPQ